MLKRLAIDVMLKRISDVALIGNHYRLVPVKYLSALLSRRETDLSSFGSVNVMVRFPVHGKGQIQDLEGGARILEGRGE